MVSLRHGVVVVLVLGGPPFPKVLVAQGRRHISLAAIRLVDAVPQQRLAVHVVVQVEAVGGGHGSVHDQVLCEVGGARGGGGAGLARGVKVERHAGRQAHEAGRGRRHTRLYQALGGVARTLSTNDV